MSSSMFVVAALVAVCAVAPSDAFLQDLLLQPLQHIQHAMQPQQQPQYYQYQYQQYPQYAQYPQYRRASEVQTLPAPVQHGVYSNSRPVVYQQWQPYSYGSAYSYSSNPLSSFLQNSWFPWGSAGRQPVQQAPQPLQAQALSTPALVQQQVQPQPQPQQPLQAFWALLPWNSNAAASQQQQQQAGPILSFLQNPSAVLPWGQASQQASRPVYTTPLAPASAPVSASLSAAPAAVPLSAVQVVSEAGAASPSVKPAGLVLDDVHDVHDIHDVPASAAYSSNGIRRVALQDVVGHADLHADGLPCAQDA